MKMTEQIIALVTFFAFPALQYMFLKWSARRKGEPALWYQPAYGFRLVIGNIGKNNTFSDIRYRAFIRKAVPAGPGISVTTYMDVSLLEREDFFLFPGTDQVLVTFRLEGVDAGTLAFILTDKLGREESRHELTQGMTLFVNYSATLENFFNFDISVAKRVEFAYDRLRGAWSDSQANVSQRFAATRVRAVG